MHPTARILLYLCSALALPGLSLFPLAAAALALASARPGRLAAMLGLAWRARWLFLLLGLGYAWGLPGPAAWPALGDWSPSLPGSLAGGQQMLRLLLLLWLLDTLVVGMGPQRLLAGLHGLFGGLAWLGFPAERSIVRLGLTLQAMETTSLRLKDLSELLAAAPAAAAPAGHYTLTAEPWRVRDGLAVLAAAAALVALWLA